MISIFKYVGKSAFGLIFFFIALSVQGKEILSLSPDDNNIQNKIEDFLKGGSEDLRIINLAPGVYRFEKSLNLPSNTVLKGDSMSSTKLTFDLKGKGNCINISGAREKTQKLVHLKIVKKSDFKDHFKVFNASPKEVGLSKWGKESLGKMVYGELIGDTLFTNARMFPIEREVLGDSIYCYKILSVEGVTIQDLTIERIDQSESQTSTIFIQYAWHCDVLRVESIKSNYSHITIENSYGCEVVHNRFINAFSHGNDGKGYGVTLQFGATNCEVSGCIFDSLRHGVVLQLGANTNWIVENYFQNGFWEDVKLPKKAAGDIVLHGNYPYMNFIEGNICNNIVIDNSHGLNGPSNLFQHNKTRLYGIYMNRKSVDGITYMLGNEVIKKGCFKGKLKYGGNEVESCDNRINQKNKKDLGDCVHVSTKEYLLSRILESNNDAIQFFGLNILEQ